MRRNHWWGAALGAGVIAGAVLLAPSAQASPHPARHKTVVKVVVQGKAAANRGRYVVKHNGDAHDHHGDGHHGDGDHGHGTPPPPPPPPPPAPKPDHHGHGDDHHHGYPGGSEPCVTVNTHHDHDGYRIDGDAKNGDTGYSHARAGVYVSSDGKKWDKAGETMTGTDGSFTYRVRGHDGDKVKVVVVGAHGGAASQSNVKQFGPEKH